jgi:hypothetical protein
VSQTLRSAFDGTPLENRRVAGSVVAREHHVGLVGHITPDELLRTLPAMEQINGFANRFLYIASRRSQVLPFGGQLPDWKLAALAKVLKEALDAAKRVGELGWTDPARDRWTTWTEEVTSRSVPGLLGAVLARARPIALRLAVIYAAADGAQQLRVEHIEAALAIWGYSEVSTRLIFGEATGDPMADRLADHLQAAGATGLSRTEQWDAIGSRNITAERLDRARQTLIDAGFAVEEKRSSAGRPSEVLVPVGMGTMGTRGRKSGFWASRSRVVSHDSLSSQSQGVSPATQPEGASRVEEP